MRLAVVALASALLAGGLAPLASAEGPCRLADDRIFCRWVLDPRELPGVSSASFSLPVFDRTLSTFIVTVTGRDNGWMLRVQRWTDDAWEDISLATHVAPADASYSHQDESTHVLLTDAATRHRLVFDTSYVFVARDAAPSGLVASTARIEITYHAQPVPDGAAPSRPAATVGDPHLRDFEDDAGHPTHDLLAAWLDDARLGDGLLDAHLRVADLNLTGASFVSPSTGQSASTIGWKLAWGLRGQRYQLEWSGRPDRSISCALMTEPQAAGEAEVVLIVPHCAADLANGTLSAVFPEMSIGAPADGEVFLSPAARTRLFGLGDPEVVDEVVVPTYSFALGGPAVWSQLDGGRKDPPQEVVPAWYEAPLREENLPDTLQVAGAVLAVATFLGGLLVVAGRRRQLREHLDRIDAVERAHERDARGALVALGGLESEFTDLFKRHRLTEGQYQALSARVASAAARLAMRRELGLDDGVPGESAPAVRVPVLDADATRTTRP